MELKELFDRIGTLTDEFHKAVERQDEEIKAHGKSTEETKTMVETLNTTLTEALAAKDARIDEIEAKLGRQNQPSGDPPAGSDEKKAAQKAAFYKWVRGGREVLSPEEKKALVEDATGQYIIEPELDAEIERLLPQITIVRGLSTVRTIGTDRIKMRSMGGVSVGWGKLETGTEITESDLTPGAPTYQYVEDLYGLALIGEDELADSDVNLEAILAEEFARALGEEEEEQFILGTGHTYQKPEGITVNATLITNTATTAAAGAIIVEDMMDLMYVCPTQFRRNGVFIVNSATELALRKLRAGGSTTTDGPFIWEPSTQAGVPNTLLGKPIYTQDNMKTLADTAQAIAIFGDMRQGYRIIDRSGMSLQRLTELYSESGLVGFKIHKRVTGGVRKASQKPLALLTEHA